MKFFLTLLVFPLTIWAQTWTEPINITPNLPGLDNQPDLCIDKNGVLHCVFTHKLASNWRKIYYTKSTNDGETWTTPEDISLNPDLSLMNPHIVADTNDILYVTYDYNIMNTAAIQVKLKTYDGNQWSSPFLVSNGMYSCHQNQLVIDNNNRVYVFWIHQLELTYYRYYENGQWSDIICPYPGDHKWAVLSAVIDDNNNIHCVGSFSDPGPPVPQSKIYFKYDYINDYWSDKTLISVNVSGGGSGIDVDQQNNPHIAWRQKTIDTGPYEDSTMYTFFNGTTWSYPEVVIVDPYDQKIAIDHYNRVHIIDREKSETGKKIVHYQKTNNIWQGYIVDIADFNMGLYSLEKSDQKLYVAYYWSNEEGQGDIRFSSYDIITGQKELSKNYIFQKMIIYPNPFRNETTIEFSIGNCAQLDISIFNLNGQHIKTIEKKEFSPGTYKFKWNGTGKNGKEVKAGLYLVRLLTGRHTIAKPVKYVK